MAGTYQVIARKWRPQTFADLVGQDHVVRTLTNAINRGRIAHAYLFVGPRGTGKTSTARIFAKALNCTDGPKADFDVNDPACVSIAEGSHLDVVEIDGASNNGVDQVRDLRETVRYAPAQGKFKVYIIDEVHMLSAQAFNALLKTLEEPPAHVKFVFATTDPQKVLPTIISRCQRFDLKPIPTDLIVERLKKIAVDEKIAVTEAALGCIARMADGGMRDAQSIFDQMISFVERRYPSPMYSMSTDWSPRKKSQRWRQRSRRETTRSWWQSSMIAIPEAAIWCAYWWICRRWCARLCWMRSRKVAGAMPSGEWR